MFLVKLVGLVFMAFYGYSMSQYNDLNGFGKVIAMSMFITVPWLYMLPWLEAARRNSKSAGSILILNVALGWTLIGWVAALLWALKEDTPEVQAAIKASTRVCPHCAETVKAEATKCKHCGSELTPLVDASTGPKFAPHEYAPLMAKHNVVYAKGKYFVGADAYDDLDDALTDVMRA